MGILTEWHQLGLKVSDRGLQEEAKRIDMHEREAFQRLMNMPGPSLAISAGSSIPILQLTNQEDKEKDAPTAQSVVSAPANLMATPAPAAEEISTPAVQGLPSNAPTAPPVV